jgi:Transglutaminase-like superfamily
MNHDDLLAHYVTPGVFTGVAGFEAQIDSLPSDAASVAGVVQGLLIHEGLAGAYGISLSPERAAEKQLHSAVAMLTKSARLDNRSAIHPRSPDKRVVGVCRHFATLFVALIRRKGVPARARCGFANYFEPDKHLDHWVSEYWNSDEGRWVLVDPQVDDVQRRLFGLDIDTLDVPRDRFLVGGDAWRACQGGADPVSFGVAGTQMWGLKEVYGDLFQDLAALQKIELLPWRWYGLAADRRGMEELALIDRLAAISSEADADALVSLRQSILNDDRLQVPDEMIAAIMAADQAVSANLPSGRMRICGR